MIQGGIYHFDNKPFIITAWSPELEFTKEELLTVPILVKFPGLDFKYWSKKGLRKTGSLVGKLIMVNHNTEKRNGLNFSRLLVEMEMNTQLPDVVFFKNKRGKLIEQKVSYDWKPTLCSHCSKYGHAEDVCRIKKKQQSQKQKTDAPADSKNETNKGKKSEQGQQEKQPVHKDKEKGVEGPLPKRSRYRSQDHRGM